MFEGQAYVYAVYKSRSFSKAAQMLYISQPALSAAIKKVEHRLGVVLFNRSKSPVELTPSGEIYIQAIEALHTLEQNTRDRLQDLQELKTGHLSIGGSNLYAAYMLPGIIADFSNHYPGIEIGLTEGSSSDLEKLLFSEALDLILDNSELDLNIYNRVLCFKDRVLLAIPKTQPVNEGLADLALTREDILTGKHLLPAVRDLNLKDLGPIPFILLKEGNDIYKRAMKICNQQHYQPHMLLKVDQLLTAYNIANTGMASTFTTDTVVRMVPHASNLNFYVLNHPSAHRNGYYYWKRSRFLSRAMDAFLQNCSLQEEL